MHPIKKDRIPACTYCDPEVASIGLTEKEAIKKGFEFDVGMFPARTSFSADGLALNALVEGSKLEEDDTS